MPAITTTKVICDGCGREITDSGVIFRDEDGTDIYFHSYACLKPYADQKTDVAAKAVLLATEEQS